MPKKKRFKLKFYFAALIVSAVFSALIFELGSYILVKTSRLPIYNPSHSVEFLTYGFYMDINQNFGVWHPPNSKFRHKTACFDVVYESNSVGARDIERTRDANTNRVIVLGDSFIEGLGVEKEERLTGLLEEKSKAEHLNFATAGNFGTTQYFLLYQNLAQQFEHDRLLIGILPVNDFRDDSYEYAQLVGDGSRYRPYWRGEYPNYELFYPVGSSVDRDFNLKNMTKAFLREFTYTYGAVRYMKNVLVHKYAIYKAQQRQAESPPKPQEHDPLSIYSGYYDFSPEEWNRMRYSLERLRQASGTRKMAIALLPSLPDLERYIPEEPTPLYLKLKEWGDPHEVTVVDLLPEMYRHTDEENRRRYFHDCDAHWSPFGSSVAAQYLFVQLKADGFY